MNLTPVWTGPTVARKILGHQQLVGECLALGIEEGGDASIAERLECRAEPAIFRVDVVRLHKVSNGGMNVRLVWRLPAPPG